MENKPSVSELKYNLVKHFEDKETTQEELNEYCQSVGLEPLVMSQLEEYTLQVELDEKASHLFDEIKVILQDLKFGMTFDTDAHAKEIEDGNEETAIKVSQAIEERAMQYRFVTTTLDEMGSLVGETVKSGGTRIFNKMSACLRHMAYMKYGEEFNSKNSKDYMIEVYGKAEEKNKNLQ
jgi:hypothetical protein